jgi:hypothetical protein
VRILRAAACIAVFAALMGISVGLAIESAGAADNCAAAPGAAAPRGQHWYYRVDQVNHRKCWYLHATVPLANRAATETRATNSESESPAETAPSPSAATPQTTDAVNAAGETAGVPAAPRVTVLNVKPVNPPSTDTPFASAPVFPAQTDEPPTATVPAAVPADIDAKPPSRSHRAAVRAAADTPHDPAATAPARSDAAATPQTRSAWLLIPLLALALGIAAGLIALLRTIGGSSGAPQLSEHPDDAWRRYTALDQQADELLMRQEDAPFLAPAEPYGAVDLDSPQWLDQASPGQHDFPAPRQSAKPWPARRENLTQKDLEPRLRILRHQTRGEVPGGKLR